MYVMTNKVRPFSTSMVRLIINEKLHPETNEKVRGKHNPEINGCIEIFRPLNRKFYAGKFTHYGSASNKFHVLYDDCEQEEIKLVNEN